MKLLVRCGAVVCVLLLPGCTGNRYSGTTAQLEALGHSSATGEAHVTDHSFCLMSLEVDNFFEFRFGISLFLSPAKLAMSRILLDPCAADASVDRQRAIANGLGG